MDNYIEAFIRGGLLCIIFVTGVPLFKLGQKQKMKSIKKGKVYYGLCYYKILLFYVIGVMCGETMLMLLLGDSTRGTIALVMTLISGVPFAALFTYLYANHFKNKYFQK